MKSKFAKQLLNKTIKDYTTITEEWHQTRQYFWSNLLFFNHHIKDGDKILDVGCGNGRFLSALEYKKVEYIGLDNCASLLIKAKEHPLAKNNSRVKFVAGDILDLPFKGSQFDVVVCVAVLHHIPSQLLREQAVAELRRVLKPGGVVIVTVWDIYQGRYCKLIVKYFLLKLFGLNKMDFNDVLMPFGKKVNRYLHAFTLSEFKKLFKKSKIKIEQSGRRRVRGKGISNFYLVGRK